MTVMIYSFKEALPDTLFYDKFNPRIECLGYALRIYDEISEPSKILEDKLSETIKFMTEWTSPTHLHRLSSCYQSSAVQSMEILQRHPNLVMPVINLVFEGRTPLLNAVHKNNAEIAKLLIRLGADVTVKDDKGHSVIYFAALEGQVNVVKEIFAMCSCPDELKKMLVDSDVYGEGHTILFPALRGGNEQLYEFLMKEDGAEEMLSMEITHPSFHDGLLRSLCEEGAKQALEDIAKIDDKIFEPRRSSETEPYSRLMWAASRNRLDIVKLIMKTHSGSDLERLGDRFLLLFYSLRHPRLLQYFLLNFPEYASAADQIRSSGWTALERAALSGCHQAAVMLLQHGALKLFRNYLKDRNSTYDFFKDVAVMDVEILRTILCCLEENDHDSLVICLNRENTKHRTPLLEVAAAGRDDLVELFLDKGANGLHKSSRGKWTALHCAVQGKWLSTVELLVRRVDNLLGQEDVEQRTALKLAVELNQPTIVKYLLSIKDRYRSDRMEGYLNTALYGIRENQTDLVSEIISGLEKDDIKKEIEYNCGDAGSVVSHLVRMFPNAAIKLLDKCFNKEVRLRHKRITKDHNMEITSYDFYFINESEETFTGPLDGMISFKRDECLAHPVVEMFVKLKLESQAFKKWYYLNLLVYLVFLICFTTHIVLLTADPNRASSSGLKGLSVISLIVCSFNMIKELFQIWFNLSTYFHDFSNYVEWTIYISAFVYFLPFSGKSDRQIEAGAIAVFLSWINFIWFLKRFSRLGIYIIMVKKIFMSLLKVLPIIVLFIIAFALVFLVLMSNDDGFDSFLISVLTTSIMVTGEIDYRDVFLVAEKSPFRLLQRLFLILIVTVGGIVLMNFLVGLAVDDTSKIMERSEAEKRLHKASAVTAMDRSLRSFSFLSTPSQIKDTYEHVKEYKFSEKVVDAHQDDMEDQRQDSDNLTSRMNALEESNNKITLQLKRITRLLEKIDAASQSKEK